MTEGPARSYSAPPPLDESEAPAGPRSSSTPFDADVQDLAPRETPDPPRESAATTTSAPEAGSTTSAGEPPGPEHDRADEDDEPDEEEADFGSDEDAGAAAARSTYQGGGQRQTQEAKPKKPNRRAEERAAAEAERKEEEWMTSVARGYVKTIAHTETEIATGALKGRVDPAELEALVEERRLDPDVENMQTHVMRNFLKAHPEFASGGVALAAVMVPFYLPRLGQTAMRLFDTLELTPKEKAELKKKWEAHYLDLAERRRERLERAVTVDAVPAKRS